MKYYIDSNNGRRKKVGKITWIVLAYLLVFAISFFVSFKLVAGTQSGEQEIAQLKEQIAELNATVASRDEKIESLELQIANIEKMLSDAEEKVTALENPSSEETSE